MDKLDVANERLDRALDELRGFNAKLDRLDAADGAHRAGAGRDPRRHGGGRRGRPEIGKGPLEKAKDALSG